MSDYLYTHASTLLHMAPTKTPGERLRELREARGWSQREAARRVGVSQTTIRDLENKPGAWDQARTSTLWGIARAFDLTDTTVTLIAQGRDPDVVADTLDAASHLEVHPEWVILPVYGSISAGEDDAEPLTDQVAYIPKDHLSRKGTNLDRVRVFLVSGGCMVSDGVIRIEKNYAPGDFIAVDLDRPYKSGDVVAAWWDEGHQLVVKRYSFEGDTIILYPLASDRTPIRIPADEPMHVLGPVVWRGG